MLLLIRLVTAYRRCPGRALICREVPWGTVERARLHWLSELAVTVRDAGTVLSSMRSNYILGDTLLLDWVWLEVDMVARAQIVCVIRILEWIILL